jgi:hypothetical protein
MKLKLVQTPGFVGRKKVAEEDLSQYSPSLQKHVADLFSNSAAGIDNTSPVPDKEKLFLELDGKRLPVDTAASNKELKNLIERMKDNLKFVV